MGSSRWGQVLQSRIRHFRLLQPSAHGSQVDAQMCRNHALLERQAREFERCIVGLRDAVPIGIAPARAPVGVVVPERDGSHGGIKC